MTSAFILFFIILLATVKDDFGSRLYDGYNKYLLFGVSILLFISFIIIIILSL